MLLYLMFLYNNFALNLKYQCLLIMLSPCFSINPTSLAAPHTHITGGYDVANKEATHLPPSCQITGSWTVTAAAQGAIRCMS